MAGVNSMVPLGGLFGSANAALASAAQSQPAGTGTPVGGVARPRRSANPGPDDLLAARSGQTAKMAPKPYSPISPTAAYARQASDSASE
jgi:hypothetical protein